MSGKQKRAVVKAALSKRAENKKFAVRKEGEEPKLRQLKHLKPCFSAAYPGGFYRVPVNSKRWVKVAVEG